MLVVCAGTATDVGKTWVGAAVLAELRRRGRSVSVRKPAQSFAADDPVDGRDAAVLAAATGEAADAVCPPDRSYAVPMAPPMAADALGLVPPTLAGLLAGIVFPAPEPDVRWVELVGGPRSPIATDADGIDLTRELAPDVVVLVADAGLGTINAVTLSVAAFVGIGHEPIVLLNRYDATDDLHRRNARWLSDHGLPALRSAEELVEILFDASLVGKLTR